MMFDKFMTFLMQRIWRGMVWAKRKQLEAERELGDIQRERDYY